MNQNNGQSEIWCYIKKNPIKIVSTIVTATLLYGGMQYTINANQDNITYNHRKLAIIEAEQNDLKNKNIEIVTTLKNMDATLTEIKEELKEIRRQR